jgi:hypothetical protein
MIPIYKPYLKKYKQSVFEAIDSEWISNHGIYIDLATEKIKKILTFLKSGNFRLKNVPGKARVQF